MQQQLITDSSIDLSERSRGRRETCISFINIPEFLWSCQGMPETACMLWERNTHLCFPWEAACGIPHPLSQSWHLSSWFALLDIGKCFMWENEKWKYVQRTVTGTVQNGVAFHTAQGKIKLKNSSINNVYVCQSSMSNHEELHVAQLSPAVCGNCLGRSNSSPLSQAEFKRASFVRSCVTAMFPVPWLLVCKATMQQSLLEHLSWCLTWFCPEHVVPLQIIIRFESDAYLKWAKWLTVHNPGLQ